jgi:hypothetical protein
MQGHPESPRLWGKYIDKALRSIGLEPTVHEPCIYSGTVLDERVLFMCQVDDFAIATPSERIGNHILDLIDDKLSIPMKQQGFPTLYNGLDIHQTRDYIKLSCKTYFDKLCQGHITNRWMTAYQIADRPTPLPTTQTFMKVLQEDDGDPYPAAQKQLKRRMGFSYRSGIGQLVYPMVCCRPDLSYTTVKLSQFNTCPGKTHYNGVRHALKYLHQTRTQGLHYWRTSSCTKLDSTPPPPCLSLDNDDSDSKPRPLHNVATAHGMSNADWAACTHTRQSFTGSLIELAGAAIAYKTKLQDTVATSSTKSRPL